MTPKEIFITIMVLTILVGADVAHAGRLKAPKVTQVKAADILAVPSPLPGEVDGPALIKEVKYLGVVTPSPKPVTVEDKIRATFPEDPETAVKIAKCESGLRPHAENKNNNGSFDYGVMQINTIHKYSKEYLMDVENNLKVARKIFDRQGWGPWVCFRKIK